MWTWALVFLMAVSSSVCQDRKLTSYLNPGCRACKLNETTLVYTRCEGAHDAVHQLWDFAGGLPTIIVAVTDSNSSLTVEWDGWTPRHFNWSLPPKYSFAVVLDEIMEYNDLNDTATPDPAYKTHETFTNQVSWKRVELVQDPKEVRLKMLADVRHSRNRNGSIVIEMELLPSTDYGALLPHLIHSGNTTLASVSLVNMTRGDFDASRFALRLLFASTDPATMNMTRVTRESLDDEHTPGIFKIVNLLTPESVKHGDGGFVQYRPVAYTAEYREVTATTVVSEGPFDNRTSLPRWSTVRYFYRDYPEREVLKNKILIGLGGTGDGFYTRTNYTAWAFTAGYGAPPLEGFSLYVVLVISVGLAVPAVVLLAGGLYVLACRRRRGGHQRLRD